MTTVDGSEVGRLGRILAEQAQIPPEVNDLATAALADPPPWVALPGTQVVRLRAMAVALEQECAELIRLTATCTCTPYPAGDGPEADCAVHDAVRAFNEATRVIAALTDALTELAHDFIDNGELYAADQRVCGVQVRGQACDLPEAHPVHRTPARVRAELEASS